VDVLEPLTTLDVTTADRSFATPQAPTPEPTALPESTVLGQPTEDPALAFSMSRLGRPVDTFTPPFPFGIAPAPRVLPAALEIRAAAAPAIARCPPEQPTRADDLLARFGASCVDEDGMREAAACLRRIAGVDLTAPPARVEVQPPARVEIQTPPPPLASGAEIPEPARAKQRRGFAGAGLALTLMVLAAGLVGGGAAVRLRPDLFGSPRHPAAPPIAPIEKTAPPAAAPAAVEPARTPAYNERLGGTRAERGSGPRAR
jgi:hypothetical protein